MNKDTSHRILTVDHFTTSKRSPPNKTAVHIYDVNLPITVSSLQLFGPLPSTSKLTLPALDVL